MKVLNSREKKRLRQQLADQYGFTGEIDAEFLLNEKRGKVYLLSRDAAEFPYEEIRVDTIGNYFCAYTPEGVRLSVEGSQIVGQHASKNVVVLDDAAIIEWGRGENVATDTDCTGIVIVAHKNTATGKLDFFGSGKISAKDGKQVILNYLPKARYVRM